MIPDACRNDTTAPSDTRHLYQSFVRIWHEMDNELCESRVEGQGRERQLLCGCLHDLDTGMTVSSGGDKEGRRVDGRHLRWPDASHQLRREGAGTAADVEHPLARSHSREVRQLRGKEARVLAHVAVVSVCCHIEAHRPSLRLPHPVRSEPKPTPIHRLINLGTAGPAARRELCVSEGASITPRPVQAREPWVCETVVPSYAADPEAAARRRPPPRRLTGRLGSDGSWVEALRDQPDRQDHLLDEHGKSQNDLGRREVVDHVGT